MACIPVLHSTENPVSNSNTHWKVNCDPNRIFHPSLPDQYAFEMNIALIYSTLEASPVGDPGGCSLHLEIQDLLHVTRRNDDYIVSGVMLCCDENGPLSCEIGNGWGWDLLWTNGHDSSWLVHDIWKVC
eukprot:scaffold2219_cov177-Amphora_coffeaeformis.AAC.11